MLLVATEFINSLAKRADLNCPLTHRTQTFDQVQPLQQFLFPLQHQHLWYLDCAALLTLVGPTPHQMALALLSIPHSSHDQSPLARPAAGETPYARPSAFSARAAAMAIFKTVTQRANLQTQRMRLRYRRYLLLIHLRSLHQEGSRARIQRASASLHLIASPTA